MVVTNKYRFKNVAFNYLKKFILVRTLNVRPTLLANF